MVGSSVIWSGNLSNDSKRGVVVAEDSQNITVRFETTEMLVPKFTAKPAYGWKFL